jgi:hypothetical protein
MNQPLSLADPHKWTRLVTFFVLLGVVCVIFIIQQKRFLLAPEPTASPSQDLQKLEIKDKSVPKHFFEDVPLLPQASTTESYTYYDPKYNKITDGVVELNSSQSPAAVEKYYRDTLNAPEFQLVKDSDKNNTDNLKVLVYSTKSGIVVIRIEETENGTKITLRDSNLLIKTFAPQE